VRRTRRFWIPVLSYGIGFVLLVLLLVLIDWEEAGRALLRASPGYLLLAFIASALSYLAWDLSYVSVNRTFGIRVGTWRQLGIGFVSVGVAHILSLGGLAQHTVRVFLLRRHGVRTGRILAASFFEAYLNAVVLYSLLPLALWHLLFSLPELRPHAPSLAAATLLFLALYVTVAAAFLFERPRRGLLRHLARFVRFSTRRDITGPLDRLDEALSDGLRRLRSRPIALVVLLLLVLAVRAAMFTSLAFVAESLGADVRFSLLASAVVLGVLSGWVSMIPGGFGVQEATMTGVLVLVGMPLEPAVLTAVLFRIVHYLAPAGASLLTYALVLGVPVRRLVAEAS
jgi:glycosyltransferase 2 family protein